MSNFTQAILLVIPIKLLNEPHSYVFQEGENAVKVLWTCLSSYRVKDTNFQTDEIKYKIKNMS